MKKGGEEGELVFVLRPLLLCQLLAPRQLAKESRPEKVEEIVFCPSHLSSSPNTDRESSQTINCAGTDSP